MLLRSWQRLRREHHTDLHEPKLSFRTPLSMAPWAYYSLESEGAVILGLPNLSYNLTHSPYIRERGLDTSGYKKSQGSK